MERAGGVAAAGATLLLMLLLASSLDCAPRGAYAGRIGGELESSSNEGGKKKEVLYKKTFRSKAFTMSPGDVINRYDPAEMPKGKVALRSLTAEVVLEDGTPVPLYETYLHHWAFVKYYIVEGSGGIKEEDRILIPNDGPCGAKSRNPQWFGIGSETRRTNYTVPAPYGIVIGDKESIPAGYEEIWILNTHAIDTRGADETKLCTECLCSLYNVSVFPDGSPLSKDYEGGMYCCEDGSRCPVQEEFLSSQFERDVYLDYTITWVEDLDDVVPVKVYILDVTDPRTSLDEASKCQVEYTVPKCPEGSNSQECVHIKEAYAFLPVGGDVIYAVAHQHMGGLGFSLHKEDGASVCTSLPAYGQGDGVGDEKGYVVGMSTCYPEPGTVKIGAGEKLTMKSYYDNAERHTGVMGLYYIMVAPETLQPELQIHADVVIKTAVFGPVAILLGVLILTAVPLFLYRLAKGMEIDYHSIPNVGP